MAIEIKNNFKTFKADFKADTGLDADKNMSEYIAYVNARFADMNYQLVHGAATMVLNKIDALPSSIGMRVGESLKEIMKGR